jgi:GR25 family glycosyltransferase involved in LPS biosynthesis
LVDGKEQMFILKDDVTLDPNSEDIFQEILDKLDIVVTSVSDAQSSEILKRNVFFKNTINIECEEYKGREITDYDKNELLKYWNLIKDKVDVKKLAQVCQWEKSINKN